MYNDAIYVKTEVITKLLVMNYKLFSIIISVTSLGKILLSPVVLNYNISHDIITINEVSIDNYDLTIMLSNSTPSLY